MNPIICFDLDDTLINGVESEFIPAYIQKISNFLASFGAKDCQSNLINATHAMTKKKWPLNTLEEEFSNSFYPRIGIPKEAFRKQIDQFYREEYPKLRCLTSINKEAIALVKGLLEKEYDLVIATNPIFPRTAIYQRLEWAGLGEYISHFKMITTFENFHYAKPNPAYYSEIIALAGWPEKNIAMVGNSLEMDILPAAEIGIPSFWLSESALPPKTSDIVRSGKLEEVPEWLDHIDQSEPLSLLLTTKAIISHLKATPAALDQICRFLDEIKWTLRPTEMDWSPVEIICHLRDADKDVNYVRFSEAIQHENPFLPSIDTESWRSERKYQFEDGKKALSEYIEVRTKFVQLISQFPEESFDKSTRHSIFGPTRLLELLQFIIRHDRLHIRQILKTLKKIDFAQ